MRYKSITLNDNKELIKYSLVKYNEEYQTQLEEIKAMNKELADYVEKCPKIYSELSDHQSYMIFYGATNCVGVINIGTSTDEKDLEIKVQFIEEKFERKIRIVDALEQLINSLGMYCYERENIEIHLLNDIDLEKVNEYKYKKNCLFENVTTYITSNKYNHRLFSALLNEIKETKRNLMDWKQNWGQKLVIDEKNLQIPLDEPLVEEIENGTIPFEEIFYKIKNIVWYGINSTKSKRNIIFAQNGQIYFTKKQKGSDKNNYEFLYNILRGGFEFKKTTWIKNMGLEIDENRVWTKIKSDNLKVVFFKKDKIKIIQYKSPIVDNSSISLQVYKNEQDEIERCYVEFRTHKNRKHKINGLYDLRILSTSDNHSFGLEFISRKGSKYDVFNDELSKLDEPLFSTILNGNLTLEIIDELIKKMIPIINKHASCENKPMIAVDDASVASDAFETELEAINYIKQIRGEIPLPHLQENLDKFLQEYTIEQNKGIKRVRTK